MSSQASTTTFISVNLPSRLSDADYFRGDPFTVFEIESFLPDDFCHRLDATFPGVCISERLASQISIDFQHVAVGVFEEQSPMTKLLISRGVDNLDASFG